ncbi:HK97 gp10 family phage protein, partial [uncultured Clostridium sp.]|uniref:HK97 gp10 family phage protein n=1 Tax=uncultured Clostridium sp. TaxID=59620 RepID=UPI0027320489
MAVVNVKNLMKTLDKLGGNSEAVFENAVERAGKAIERYAKDYCPESGLSDDTLRDSIHFEMVKKDGKKTTGRVVTNHEYASYVEFGTGPVGAKSGGVASKLAGKITYKSEGWYIP